MLESIAIWRATIAKENHDLMDTRSSFALAYVGVRSGFIDTNLSGFELR